MGESHARLAASSSHRWVPCPGSINACVGIPNPGSAAAKQGTGAHALAEKLVMAKKSTATSMLGKTHEFEYWDDGKKEDCQLVVDEEMVLAVDVLIELINSIHVPGKSILQLEQKLSLEFLRPGMFGTADTLIDFPLDVLHVIDFKYGFTPVFLYDTANWVTDEHGNLEVFPEITFESFMQAEPNPQLMYYATGALHREGWLHDEAVLYIVQPRCFELPNIQKLRVPTDYVRQWAYTVLKPAALKTELPDAPLVPGEHCRWCPALPTCPAVAKHTQALAGMDFAEEIEVEIMTNVGGDVVPTNTNVTLAVPDDVELLAKVLKWAPILDAYLRACSELALEKLSRGEKVPGFKLVRKKSNRRWADAGVVDPNTYMDLPDDVVVKRILAAAKKEKITVNKGDLYNLPELKSPAQMEKLHKDFKKVVSQVAYKPLGDVTLADTRDPRAEVVKSIEEFKGSDEDLGI